MTEKRFTYDSKTVSILKDEEFWLDGNVDTACNHSEICNELNKLNDENEQLKIKIEDIELELENTKDRNDDAHYELYQVKKKNEQLKTELVRRKVVLSSLQDSYNGLLRLVHGFDKND